MDKKQMLKDGLKKKTVYLLVGKDINGKEHFTVVEDLDIANLYKTGEDVRPVTMFMK